MSWLCVRDDSRNLRGVDEILDLRLLVLVNLVCEKPFEPLKCFPKLFQGLDTMSGIFTPRSITAGWHDKTKEESDKMLSIRVIECVKETTE